MKLNSIGFQDLLLIVCMCYFKTNLYYVMSVIKLLKESVNIPLEISNQT